MDILIQYQPGLKLEAVEKQVILAAFRFFRGNRLQTASALGIALSTLDSKLKKFKEDVDTSKDEENARKQRNSEQLKRMRGERTPNYLATAESERAHREAYDRQHASTPKRDEAGKVIPSADAGLCVEPAVGTSTEQTVPVSERKEVQRVSPAHASKSGNNRAR